MIDVVIFSKDRAAQLDLLLRSMQINGARIFNEPLVLYRASDADYAQAYTHLSGARFQEEANLKFDVMEAVRNCGPLFCFLVDDQIMWRKPEFDHEDINRAMLKHPKAACLSLRLGENTSWQYQTQRHIRKPQFKTVEPFLLWNRKTCDLYTNYNYPLSVDGHIFHRDEILKLLEQAQFTQPNQLEAQLQAFVSTVGPLMLCPTSSVFVNAAVNRVQNLFPNKVGSKEEYKALEMNQRFLGGDRLSLERTVKDLEVNSCHQEIDLQWEECHA